jgi:pimeloyl-ACP methyl ester carboxylesterase
MDPAVREARVHLGAAPALLVWQGDRARAAERGAILFYHGLGAAKEANRPELESLARAGFLAVGLDNVGNGERRYRDFDARFAAADPRPAFLEAVAGTAREAPRIVDALAGEAGRFGVSGISMGAYIGYGALLREPRLGVAALVLGSPRWWLDSSESPHRHPGGFYPRAVLSQNAGRDENVPPGEARAFHAALEPFYAEAPDRQRFVEFPGSGHFMAEADWQVLWRNVLAWFTGYLADGHDSPAVI